MSLTLHDARARAALLSDVAYDLALDLTERDTFGVRARITFACAEPGASTFLELHDAREVRVDGKPAEYVDGRIPLRDLGATNERVVEARLPYVTDGEGMHTFTDPADGEVYAAAYVGMDLAHRVFPCFDQNDLKAPISLVVTAPPHWTVLANARATGPAEDGRWAFASTPPIPPAMFVVCGGPWVSVTWEHAGLDFGWHARASLAGPLERDAADLRRVTETCFDHYARVFAEPYPFDSYDQVMVPGQNWGAVETPGCITYRDEMLPLSAPTEPERRIRSMVIAHEMAHMWFGDLVTMTWWEDTWLQESFADYLGYRVSEEAAGIEGAFVDFTIGRKPEAYAADERRSTHPVAPRAEDVPDVDAASTNFDSLSYAKGNSALRQLVTWIGDDAFFAGVNAYLSRHKWGNATLDDFVAALDTASDRDVRGWVEGWLRRTGFDTLRVERNETGPLLVRDGSRAHRVRVSTYDESFRPLGSSFLDVGDDPVRLPDAPVVVPNAAGETFARVRLDERSWAAVAAGLSSVPEPATRALLWSTAFDLVWTGELAAAEFLDLVARHLPTEPVSSIVAGVLRWSRSRLLPLFVPADGATPALASLAAVADAALAATDDAAQAEVLTRFLAGLSADPDRLRGWIDTGDPTLRWLAVHRLAALGDLDADAVEALRAADGTIVADLGAARARAAIPTVAAKAAAWQRLTGDTPLSNREFEAVTTGLWDLERADLLGEYVDRYSAEAPGLATELGATFADQLGDAFPAVALSAAQVATLEGALAGEVPTLLRRPWEDRLDDVRRGLLPR